MTASGLAASTRPIRLTMARAQASPRALSRYETRRLESSSRDRRARRGSVHGGARGGSRSAPLVDGGARGGSRSAPLVDGGARGGSRSAPLVDERPGASAHCAETAVTTSGPSLGPRPFSSMPTRINDHHPRVHLRPVLADLLCAESSRRWTCRSGMLRLLGPRFERWALASVSVSAE
jgi:hypothetical protein